MWYMCVCVCVCIGVYMAQKSVESRGGCGGATHGLIGGPGVCA